MANPIEHTPFRLRVGLRTGMAALKHPLHLDGLLEYLAYGDTGCRDAARQSVGQMLSHRDGIYQCSALAFGVTGEQGLGPAETYRVRALRQGELTSKKIKPTGRRGKYAKVQVAGGAAKRIFEPVRLVEAPFVVFDALGDATRVVDLIEAFCLFLGPDRELGLGEVGEVRVLALPEGIDRPGWVDEQGRLARTLPRPVYERQFGGVGQIMAGVSVHQGRFAAPYHEQTGRCEVVSPDRYRKIFF